MPTSRSARPTSAVSPAGPDLRAWWQAARPATLAASVAPVLIGSAVALHDGARRPLAALPALLLALMLQVGVNFANDYSDHQRGADTPARIGPPRLAASGLAPPKQVRNAALAFGGLAAVIGLGLAVATDVRLVLLGAACLLAAWLYTGGPRPYGYLGLGEVFVFIFFGLVAAAGTAYLIELRISGLAILSAVVPGSIAAAVLALNNLRDIETDAAAGKRTLAVRLGRRGARALVVVLLVVALAVPVIEVALGWVGVAGLLPLLLAPMLIQPARALSWTEGPILISALKQTAAFESAFALAWALGFLLG